MKKHEDFDLSLINKENLDIKINNKDVNLTDWQPISFKTKYLVIKLKIENPIEVS